MSNIITFNLDPAHSSVNFSIKHLAIATVRGDFSKITGTLTVDPDDLSTFDVDATIDASSFHTSDAARDNHVKSAEILDVAQFPTIEFKGKSASKTGDGAYSVNGELTLHGVTKPVTIDFSDQSEEVIDMTGSKRFAIAGKTKINRNDYGVTFNAPLGAGKLMLGEVLTIDLDLQFVRPS